MGVDFYIGIEKKIFSQIVKQQKQLDIKHKYIWIKVERFFFYFWARFSVLRLFDPQPLSIFFRHESVRSIYPSNFTKWNKIKRNILKASMHFTKSLQFLPRLIQVEIKLVKWTVVPMDRWFEPLYLYVTCLRGKTRPSSSLNSCV